MPPLPSQESHDLGDFADFLRQLSAWGFEFAVIGGMAVSSYARLIDEAVLSVDLDLYVTQATLAELLSWAPRHGHRVVKRPRPRHLPVAFLESDGKEVNILTSTAGLPVPEMAIRTARQFILEKHGRLEVLLVDPFDLLANKMAVRRDKDLPHIEIMRRYVEAEAVEAFLEEERPRARLEPARRLLEVLGTDTLPEELTDRLLDHVRTPVDFRFLAGRLSTGEQARRLIELSREAGEELRRELEEILVRRGFGDQARHR